MIKVFILLFIIYSNSFANDKVNYLMQYYKKHEAYNKNTKEQYERFIKAYKSSIDEYIKNISKYWKVPLITNEHLYVKYSNNFKQRTIIDYKKETISVQTIAKNIKIAQQIINKRYKDLFLLSNQKAFRDELVLRNTYRKLAVIYDTPLDDELLIGDYLDSHFKDKIIQISLLEEYKEKVFKNNRFYFSIYKLPKSVKESLIKINKKVIDKYQNIYNLPNNLIFSMIKVKTSFNPYALTSDARFGAMLINSKTIGLQAYYELYKDRRILDAAYLFNLHNNIKIGSTYLNILYNKKLKDIKDEKTKLYLTVLAYEIGVKNSIELFNNIDNINAIKPAIIYRKILNKIKNRNLRIYFTKVTRLML